MSDWRSTTIGEIAQIFDGPHATPTRRDVGPYFLSISSLQGGRLDLSASDHLSDAEFETWTRRVTPQADDLLFSYETRLGEAALMPSGIDACLGRRMGLLRVDRGQVDPRFLLYAYLGPDFQRVIVEHTIHGATVDRIPLNSMGKWMISIPSLSGQRAIAEVLGALDDKIAANTRLAATATELADAKFREATAGRAAALPLRDVCDVVTGVSYRSVDLVEGRSAMLTLKCFVRGGKGFQSSGFKSYVGDFRLDQMLEVGDIVVAQTDLTQAAEVVGSAIRVPAQDQYDTLVASLDTAIVRMSGQLPREYVLGALRQPEFRNHCQARTTGTTVLHLRRGAIGEYEVPVISGVQMKKYAEDGAALRDAADASLRGAQQIGRLRDALLPALMSGRLTVRDAEHVVSDAGV